MSLKMRPRGRSNRRQLTTMLEFMERHGDIAYVQSSTNSRERTEQLWEELTMTLNSYCGGVAKSTERWKKAWTDWKSKTKRKLLFKRQQSAAGGAPYVKICFTDLEKRLLAVMTTKNLKRKPRIQDKDSNTSVNQNETDSVPEAETLSIKSVSESQSEKGEADDSDPLIKLERHSPIYLVNSHPKPSGIKMNPSGSERHRRAFIPFNRRDQFAEIEMKRLKLEYMREKNEARRIEVEHEKNLVLKQFADIAAAMLEFIKDKA